jgi:hypothetical protein
VSSGAQTLVARLSPDAQGQPVLLNHRTQSATAIDGWKSALATDARILEPTGRKYRLPEHRHQRGQPSPRSDFCPEEKLLLARLPEAAEYLEALKKRCLGRVTLPLRRLLRLVNDFRGSNAFTAVCALIAAA